MPDFFLPEPSVSSNTKKTGVLLLNLGSPAAPTAKAVRQYLKAFLSDQRVIEQPAWKWQPILQGLILPLRSATSAAKYQKIWLEEGAPLLVYTARQAKLLQEKLGENYLVDYAMTYGAPSPQTALQNLKAQGITQIVVLPLFPQYSSASTGAALDALFRTLSQQRNMVEIKTISRFFDHPAYIGAMAQHIRQHWAMHGQGEHLLMSFHGLPISAINKGDPYQQECLSSARLIASELELSDQQYSVSFQSRFGKDKWLEPATSSLLVSFPGKKINRLDVVCPGFVADCLETLEEMVMEGGGIFAAAGGDQFHYIPCLNTQTYWINALIEILKPNLVQ